MDKQYGIFHFARDNAHLWQFDLWMKLLFDINDYLHKQDDVIYQRMLYVVITELFNEGEKCIEEAINTINLLYKSEPLELEYETKWYSTIQDGINELKSKFDDIETQYIEYMRHNICHIHQNSYSEIDKKNEINFHRERSVNALGGQRKTIVDLQRDISIVEERHNYRFGNYLTTTLYPVICKLWEDLETAKNYKIARERQIIEDENAAFIRKCYPAFNQPQRTAAWKRIMKLFSGKK